MHRLRLTAQRVVIKQQSVSPSASYIAANFWPGLVSDTSSGCKTPLHIEHNLPGRKGSEAVAQEGTPVKERSKMADHKNSGYISTFWQVLFAPFIQLFTRMFFPSAKEKTKPPPSTNQDEREQGPGEENKIQRQQQQQPQPQPQLQEQEQGQEREQAQVQAQQKQQQRQQQQQQQSSHLDSSFSPSSPPIQPEPQLQLQSPPPPPSPPIISYNPGNLPHQQDQQEHHQKDQYQHQHQYQENYEPQQNLNPVSEPSDLAPDLDLDPDLDLELDLDFSSHDDPMAATKKRGGQRRGGVKANGPKTTANANANVNAAEATATTSKNTTTPALGDQSNNKPTSQTTPNATSNTSAPAGVTPLANQRDTTSQPDAPKPTASRRGSRGGRNRGRSSPTKQLVEQDLGNIVNHQKENVAPPKDYGPQPAQSAHSATAKSPAPADNKAEPQKPGTRSQDVTKIAAAPTRPMNDQNTASQESQVEHVRIVVDRLTLDETPASEQTPEQGLNKATAAAETSAVSVPVVVAIPIPGKAAPPKLSVPEAPATPLLPGLIEPKTEEERVEREYHLKYMREALDMGQLALNTNETPVGCVLVYHGRTIAKGMNATNVTRNGTRHAEFMALSALLSKKDQDDVGDVNANPALDDASWGDVDPRDGHIYPYGQKLHPAPVVDRSIISECILYVTVEPCVMCASLLRQLGIKKVYFGAVNDKFGGTGGVFRIHVNSKPIPKPHGRPYQNGYGPPDVDRISKGRVSAAPRDEDDGDGGNVEPGFPAEGGYLRDDAVSLLRRFYVQENGRAPQPRKKEGRAARLFAMENQAKTGCPNGSTSEFSDTATLPDTPVDAEPPTDDREILNSPAGTVPDT
ncbi:hypothetical protein F4810DRAFT_676558 [Camillea tinctor]|nr:hypothetical protein F4810DRAFT_676558 [Camillea tinctor]